MGFLSKVIKKGFTPKPKEVVPSKESFEQKKITNPLVKKRVPNLQTSDYQKELDNTPQVDATNRSYNTPDKKPSVLGQLYSPVRSTIEQIQFGKQGIKGENLAKRVKESAPNVSGSEKNFANIKLDPKKRYTQTELLDLLEGKVDNYEVRFRKSEVAKNKYRDREKRKSNALWEGTQRQKIEDKELDYFELTVHTPRINPEVERITDQHFAGGVTAHTRVSLREDSQGKRYILLEESQSDAARMADTIVDRAFGDETFDMNQFDRQEEINKRLENIPDLSKELNESTFSLDDDSIYKNRFSDSTYIKQIIEEDPILSADIKKDGGRNFTSSELGIALEDLENRYKRQDNNIAKDVNKYYEDLGELVNRDIASRKTRIEGGAPLRGEYGKPLDSSKLHSKGFMEKYGNSLEHFQQNLKDSDQDLDVFGGLSEFDESKAKKNAEDLIKKLKNKYKHLKDDEFFNYDFLVSQDATTLFKFNDVDQYTYGIRIDKVKEDMFPFLNEDIPGQIADGMREVYEENFLDPINRIFSYAYKQDFKNYAENQIPKLIKTSDDPNNPLSYQATIREQAIDPLNRLVDKAVKTEVISTDIYKLTDNVFHKQIDKEAANREYDKLFGELEEGYDQQREGIGGGIQEREKLLYKKSDIPVNTRMEIMLSSLKSAIILAKKEGVDEIVIPSAQEIAKLRGSTYDDAFKKLYTDGLRKALNQLQQDTKGNIKVGTRVLRHDPDGAGDADFMLDDKPMYDKNKYRESFATSINIRELLFDPETEALRFNIGGSVPSMDAISEDAKREALLAGININRNNNMMERKISLFNEGGLRDEGGQVEPQSGNKVPSGSLKEEVADDVPVMMSEGEFVFPADVTRFIGLKTLMKMRQDAKQGLKTMEDMGQMGNSEEATLPDDMPFEMADLIVVSGDEPKKMQTGGLLDDPRFQRPTGGGGETPTITDEEKKEMEDALLRTGYGNVTMKRYVNADGDVKYIPFIGGEPQMDIPEGYELDESAPKTESNIGGSVDSGGGGDSGGPASPAPVFGDGMTFEKPRGPMVDGVEYENIQKMDAETLIKYYEQFNSPIYRYAATFATLFFSPLVGGAIAIGQSYGNKNSPTGLSAVQKELMTRRLTKEQRTKIKGVYDSIAKNGAGGLSAITKGVTNFLGVTSDPKKGEKETLFEKYLRTGNIVAASKELNNAINNSPENQKAVIDAANKNMNDFFGENQLGELGSRPEDFVEKTEPTSGLQTKIDSVTGEAVEGDPFAPPVDTTPAAVERTTAATVDDPFAPQRGVGGRDRDPRLGQNFSEVDSSKNIMGEAKRVRGESNAALQRADETIARAKEVRRERDAEEALERLQPGTRQPRVVEKRTKQDEAIVADKAIDDFFGSDFKDDEDRQGGGASSSSAIDDFFGSDFGMPSQPAPKTDTYADLTGNPFGDRGRTQTSPSIGTGGGGGGQRFGPTGGFYVGGVPTKPMKPQKLKKGGLAKIKVKPKRMKKGGLASRKK